MINEVINKLQNIVKYAFITLVSKDDKVEAHQAKVQYQGRQATVNIMYPYGLAANAPSKSLVLLFSVGGQEANRAGIVSATLIRPKDLKEGEVVIGNFVTKATIKFNEDGSIDVIGKGDINITAESGDVNIESKNGKVSVTADDDVDVKANTVNVDASQTNLGVGGKKIALDGDKVVTVGSDLVIQATGINTSI